METARYDPEVIQEFADKLYAEANWIVNIWIFLGLLFGLGGGYIVGPVFPDVSKLICALIGGTILGLLGRAIGTSRAFLLKLKAQTALCQVRIEKNTRGISALAESGDN